MKRQKLLLEKLKQIDTAITNNYKKNTNLGVLAGISGISLFHFYYAKFLNKQEPADVGSDMISEAVERINEGYVFPTYCSGIAGTGWVLELLSEEDFIDVENDELLPELDEYLFEAMKLDVENDYFDFLHGAVGYGYYFLKRFKNTKSIDLKKRYQNYLTYLIDALKKSSKSDGTYTWWNYELDRDNNINGVNLSLSHGMSSVINFLSRLYPYGEFKGLVEDLLIKATNYIVNKQYKDSSNSSLFPSWIQNKSDEYVDSRLAWCYGDLGIGISLWHVGKALQNDVYQELATKILKHSANRRDLKEARVNDAGLCHGAYGIVTIYNYMYKQTAISLFKDTADYWIDQALKLDIHKDGYAGYMIWRGDKDEWLNEVNLLEGITGIGLAIISYLATYDTQWQECLLIK